jgi:hypothetical protein
MGEANSMQHQLEQALALPGDRGVLLRAIGELAAQPEFSKLVPRWAPTLYARDARVARWSRG